MFISLGISLVVSLWYRGLYEYVDYYMLVLYLVKNLLKNRATALRVSAR
jgi:hypothetical protein